MRSHLHWQIRQRQQRWLRRGSWVRPSCRSIVMRDKSISTGAPTPILPFPSPVIGKTYRPLGKSDICLTSTLSNQALLLLEASADDTGGDGQVPVVAVQSGRIGQQKAADDELRWSCKNFEPGGVKTHVRPADFHAKTILTVACGLC